MKKILVLITVVSVVACAFCAMRKVREARFHVTGTVTVPARLAKVAETDNNSCTIIVKNAADVPVAIKRVVNPKFPLQFQLEEEDLLATTLEGDLKLEVQINSHGKLGVIKEGDIFGSASKTIKSNAKDVIVQADKMTGMPRLARNARGNFFRTAAR
ncbi:MAG: hypothetical protein IKL48_00335 [Elusimicrobiaceae bacterium]|nr:hypothetical protein [Elusimicrobiaceae bacterium]